MRWEKEKAGKRHEVRVNTPNGFSIFADQQDRIVINTFDNIDSSLAFMFEFMTYGDVENFLFHDRLMFPGAKVRYPFNLDGKVNQVAFLYHTFESEKVQSVIRWGCR